MSWTGRRKREEKGCVWEIYVVELDWLHLQHDTGVIAIWDDAVHSLELAIE